MLDKAKPSLRRAEPADVQALSALKLATFRETFLEDFGIPYPPVDLAQFERETYAPGPVAAELADPAHQSWVCEGPDGTLLAYAHAGPCKLPHADVHSGSGELYQIYVRRGAQGQGLGRMLLKTAFDWLSLAYPGPQWIGVWSGNHKAQAVYGALGFRKVGDYRFRVGNHFDAEFIFRRD